MFSYHRFIEALNILHPKNVDVKRTSNANSYKDSRTKIKIEHKEKERNYLLKLFERMHGNKKDPVFVYYLDCENFLLSQVFSSMNICAVVPNWSSKTLTTNNPEYNKVDNKKVNVFGSCSHEFTKSICSIPEEWRPKFGFIWIDSCNNYGTDQDQEIHRLFEHRFFMDRDFSILAVTYSLKLDFRGILNQDTKTTGIAKSENIKLRILEHAVKNNYNIMLTEKFEFDGMITLVFIVSTHHDELSDEFLTSTLNLFPLNKLAYIPNPSKVPEMDIDDFYELSKAPKQRFTFVPPVFSICLWKEWKYYTQRKICLSSCHYSLL
jgi:hypothetical protein